MAAPQAELKIILKSSDYTQILKSNMNNSKYNFKGINEDDQTNITVLVSLLDYYDMYKDTIKRITKIQILQMASSLIQKLLTRLGSTASPNINRINTNVIQPIIPGQPDLTGLLTYAITEVDTEMKTVLQKETNQQKDISMSAKSEVNTTGVPNPDGVIIDFDKVDTCAGEGCFYTKEQFKKNLLKIKENKLPIKITLNSLDNTTEENIIDSTTLLNIINSKDFSYKVFGIPNLNTKKIIQDLNNALEDDFNTKTTYQLETISSVGNVYGFTIELQGGSSATLNEKHKGLTKLEVLFQHTCQKDLSKLTKEDKDAINMIEQFTSLLETLKLLHEQNIVHLDIKLQNIMKCDNTFRFIDFAIGKLDENTKNFITTYHISTNNRLDYTQYIMEEWIKLDKQLDKRNTLIPLALPIFKLTDLFCLLFAYLSMINIQGIAKYLKAVVTDEGSKVKGNTIIDIDDLYKNKLVNSSQDPILYNFKEQIDKAVREFKNNTNLIQELKLEQDKLNLTKLIELVDESTSGGKSKKKKQRGGLTDEEKLINSIRGVIIAKINEIYDDESANPVEAVISETVRDNTVIDDTVIQTYLESIPKDFRNKHDNANIVKNYVAYRYLANNYIPMTLNNQNIQNNEIQFKQFVEQRLKLVTSMAGLLKEVNEEMNKPEQVTAEDEEAISTSIRQNTSNSNNRGGSSKVQSFFNQYKNTFFISTLKSDPTDKVIYVYRLDNLISVTTRTLEVSRYKIDLEKNPTVSLKNLKSKKFQVALSKDNKRLKLEKNYLVPL